MATVEQAVTKTAASTATVYKNFIGGEWVESHTGPRVEPTLGQKLAERGAPIHFDFDTWATSPAVATRHW